MQIAAVTVENFRSITQAHKLRLGSSTVLIGRNNEGKSNILRALVLGLGLLKTGRRTTVRGGPGREESIVFLPRPFGPSQYQWEQDFPIALQKEHPGGASKIILDFELNESDLSAFQKVTGSYLNGNLPIRLSFAQAEVSVSIAKQGPRAKQLTSKAAEIADFVQHRLDFQYIPAIRTAQRAQEVVDAMVATALRKVEDNRKYKAALKAITEVQKPVLDEISVSIKKTLVQFLPAIKDVKVRIGKEERTRALRTSSEIVIDDGSPTPLKHKGDGVQSLAAIALMRHAATAQSSAKHTIIALEEPESHLHPNAIHELKVVLQELAKTQQIVITTHCPLFVNRVEIGANIIVDNNKARAADRIDEIRDLLGVRAADNLRHAELLLIVEGADDALALTALLQHHSERIRVALEQGALLTHSLDGAANLSYKASLLRDSLCDYYCFLDNDDAGRNSFEVARKNGLLTDADCTFTICNGMAESEIEDLFEPDIYRTAIETAHSVRLDVRMFRSRNKWSDRMRIAFQAQGRQWNDRIKMSVKTIVAQAVAQNPSRALNQYKRGSFDGLTAALEQRLNRAHG